MRGSVEAERERLTDVLEGELERQKRTGGDVGYIGVRRGDMLEFSGWIDLGTLARAVLRDLEDRWEPRA